ncbi:MAG: VTT domain-containing protein [Candidatus ainarchaeum sp.]|nr:VTT domain-containing protein [Candidatus ainarchaeum sp.]
MDKRIVGILQILFAVAIVAVTLYFSNEIAGLAQYGYLGAFVITMFSSATILFPAPGWAVVIALASALNPVLLGIVAGIGSSVGELTGYLVGGGTRDIINSRIKESRQISEFVKKYDLLAVFVLAFIPNPAFDVAGIAAGGLKIAWWRFLLACMAGRVLRYVLLAFLGKFTLELL